MGNGKLEVLDKRELVEKLIDRVGCFMTHFLATFENFETKTFGFVPMNDNRFQEFRKKKDNSLTTKEIDGVTCKKVYNPYLGNVTKKSDTMFMTGFRYDESYERRTGEKKPTNDRVCPNRVILNRNKMPSPLMIRKEDIVDGKSIDNPRLYLRGEYDSSKSEYFTADTNQPIDKAEIKLFISVPNPNKPKPPINFKGPGIDRIDRIKIDGQWYGLYKGPKLSGVAEIIPAFEAEPEIE